MAVAHSPFDFRSRTPTGHLRRLVRSTWYARGRVAYRREKIAPTGSSVAVLVLGDPLVHTSLGARGETIRAEQGFLVGPHDQPSVNEPTGETFAVGIVASPVGCEAVFGIRPANIRGRAIELLTAWSKAETLRRTLLGCTDPEQMLDRLDECLADISVPSSIGFERCERSVALLGDDPARPIADVARALGVSHARLDRDFSRTVGLSPRSLARILRLGKLLARIDVTRPIDWADLALNLGWSDQSHFIRDFKRYTGASPSRYVAAQLALIEKGDLASAAGFVPEA